MFHGKHPSVHRAAEWAGFALDEGQVARLEGYADWLISEAIPAGGLGPREAERVWTRHLADSLTFAAGWSGESPTELLDIGTGVGLPGIPLSILWPDTHVTLLDRGGRRIRLLRRAVRILGIEHVIVAQGDAFAVADQWDAVVYRGSIKAQEAVGLSSRILTAGGVAVLGLSRRAEPPATTRDLTTLATAMALEPEIRRVPDEVLDGPAWLLIMRAQ